MDIQMVELTQLDTAPTTHMPLGTISKFGFHPRTAHAALNLVVLSTFPVSRHTR